MKTLALSGLVLLGLILAAQSRLIQILTKEEMKSFSDLIVVGTAKTVNDLNETTNMPGFGKTEFHGVETEFRVVKVIKGDPMTTKVLLHHYRLAEETLVIDGPSLVSFTPNKTNEYMLYLKKDGLIWHAPTSGQVDPAFSVQKLK